MTRRRPPSDRPPRRGLAGPAPLLERYRGLVDDFEAFLEASRRPLPTCVWAHPRLADADDLAAALDAAGFGPSPLDWLPGAFRLAVRDRPGYFTPFLAGRCHVQEEVSLVPPHLLDPRPGERVLDLCAAPGGKTLRIALAMRDRGTVVANDRNPGRIRALRNNLERLGVLSVVGTSVNGAVLPAAFGPFDRVLCDAPCSGEGNSRKSPAVLAEDGERDRSRLAALQEALLTRAFQVCRPGGRIVYSTCTYAPEENEAVVDAVLRRVGDALRVAPASVPGLRHAPGLTGWRGATFRADVGNALRFWAHANDTGGFFVAVLEKAADAEPSRGVGPDPAWRPPAADASRCLETASHRFGIDPAAFDGLHFFQLARRHVEMIHADAAPPRPDLVQFQGAPFFHVNSAIPLPTSVTARVFGDQATRNVVELAAAELSAYFARAPLALRPAALAFDTAPGWVLVRHEGVPLGTGLLRVGDAGATLESFFPSGYARPGGGGG